MITLITLSLCPFAGLIGYFIGWLERNRHKELDAKMLANEIYRSSERHDYSDDYLRKLRDDSLEPQGLRLHQGGKR